MKSKEEILQRLDLISQNISLLDSIIEQEMKKTIVKRRVKYLLFLSKEKSIYDFARQQIEWIVKDAATSLTQ